jgi:hypothetical protein
MHRELGEYFENNVRWTNIAHFLEHPSLAVVFLLCSHHLLVTCEDGPSLIGRLCLQVRTVDSHAFTYGDGFMGSHNLRSVTASFLNQRFSPISPVLPHHVAVTSGVGPALEICAFSLCDPGDGILLGRPFSGSLPSDLALRAG